MTSQIICFYYKIIRYNNIFLNPNRIRRGIYIIICFKVTFSRNFQCLAYIYIREKIRYIRINKETAVTKYRNTTPPHHICQRVDLHCQFYRSNVPKKNVVKAEITGSCFYIVLIETELNFKIRKARVTNHKIYTCCYGENY